MQSLQIKMNELKSNIINKDLKQLKKNKYKIIPTDKNKYDESIKNYNYYIKLTKKIKKYIKDDYVHIVDTRHDKYGNIVWLVAKFDISQMEIEMPIDIRIITDQNGDTYMNCAYYNEPNGGILYINIFESRRYNQGYGKLLLENLVCVVNSINNKFDYYNNKNNISLKNIEVIKGKAMPTESIINQFDLNRLYKKYGFEIDDKNNIIKRL